MNHECVQLRIEDKIAWLTLSRPNKLNAINGTMRREFASSLAQLEENDNCRLLVLRGAGRAFSVGSDVNEFANRTPLEMREVVDASGLLERFTKPVIAMLHGFTLGGGAELALACDIRVASDDLQIGFPEINLGLFPGGGGTQRLPRLVGIGRAMLLVLSGRSLDATEAARIGLVDLVVPVSTLEAETSRLAAEIAQKSPVAVRLARDALKMAAESSLETGLRYERELLNLAFATEDSKEGIRAFLEKREARFRGL